MKTKLSIFLLSLILPFLCISCSDSDEQLQPLDKTKSILSVEKNNCLMEFYLTDSKAQRTEVFHEGEEIYFNVRLVNLSDTTGISHTLSEIQEAVDSGIPLDDILDEVELPIMEIDVPDNCFSVFTSEGELLGRSWDKILSQINIINGANGSLNIKAPWYFCEGERFRSEKISFQRASSIPRLAVGNYYAMAPITVHHRHLDFDLVCRVDFQIVP